MIKILINLIKGFDLSVGKLNIYDSVLRIK